LRQILFNVSDHQLPVYPLTIGGSLGSSMFDGDCVARKEIK